MKKIETTGKYFYHEHKMTENNIEKHVSKGEVLSKLGPTNKLIPQPECDSWYFGDIY